MHCSQFILSLIAAFGSPLITYELSAADNTQVTNIGQDSRTQPDIMLKKLSVIIQNYKAAPGADLTDQNVDDLIIFATSSIGPTYDQLSKMDRSSLSQILNLNADRFSPVLIAKFNDDQKLAARMSTKDIESLKMIVVNIRDGKILTDRQISDVKDFKTMISRNPYAFIPELYIIAQYVPLNPNVFTSSDIDVFRQASRDASGITSADTNLLNSIANRENTVLNRDDISVLNSLGIRGPIGSLNGFTPETIIVLNKIVNDNTNRFPANSVSSFNRAFNDNQAIQFYVTKSRGRMNPSLSGSQNSPTSAGQR